MPEDRMLLKVPADVIDEADFVQVEPKSRRVFAHRHDSGFVHVMDGWSGEVLDQWPLALDTIAPEDLGGPQIVALARSLVAERLLAGY